MAQEHTGEFPGISPRDEYDELLDEVIAADAAEQVAEFEVLRATLWLTDLLKDPDCPIVCLSYPDGTLNQTGINLFEDGQIDEILFETDAEDIITDEKWLYSVILDLLHISENPDTPNYPKVVEVKQQIISVWMKYRGLPFTSSWVSFLNDILPGGKVTEPDIESAEKMERETRRELAEAIQEITNKLIPEYREGSAIDGMPVCEIARYYVETTLESICEPLKEGGMTKEEFDERIAKIQASFFLSDWTHWECLSICAAMSNCDLSGFVQK